MFAQVMKPLLSFVLLFNLCACSGQYSEPQLLPENTMSTTGMGAATGAVLGAGVGLIIGSSTGNAGEGVLLGSLAGATAGGIIGNEFEQQEEQQINNREIIERHDEILDRQQREIDGMRDMAADEPSISHKPKRTASVRRTYPGPVLEEDALVPTASQPQARAMLAPEKKFPSPKLPTKRSSYAQPKLEEIDEPIVKAVPKRDVYRPLSEVSSEREYINAPSRISSQTRERIAALKNGGEKRRVERSVERREVVKKKIVAPKKQVAKKVAKKAKPVEKKKVVAKKEIKKEIKKPVVAKAKKKRQLEETELSVPARKPITTQLAKVAVKPEVPAAKKPAAKKLPAKKLAKKEVKETKPAVEPKKKKEPARSINVSSNDCKGAEVEAARARKASSDADKLFYFRRAIRKCPNSALYHLEIAKVFSGIGRKDDAEYELRQALSLDPSNVQAQDQLTLLQAGE